MEVEMEDTVTLEEKLEKASAQDATRKDRAKRPRPYALEPLIDFMTDGDLDEHAAEGLYHKLGVNRQWWQRHKKTGLTFWEADRVAIRAHAFAWDIWPEWSDDEIVPNASDEEIDAVIASLPPITAVA